MELLAPLKVSARDVIAGLIKAGLHPEHAALVHFALDGLWISELLGTSPLSPEERERLIATITDIGTFKDSQP